MKNKTSKIILILLVLMMTLLISACKKTERPPFLPQYDPAPPPEMRWDVQTDFSIHTPFVPRYSLHTRLHDGALPELIPSDNYGMLLPYSSATVLNDGSLRSIKFGFVTIDGVVVTDLIYDSVNRAEYRHGWHVGAMVDEFPAYSLSKMDTSDTVNAWVNTGAKMAACALDGSWITPFNYINIAFTEDAILLVRDETMPNIDVIDYNGNHLYNMLDLDWISDIPEYDWSSANLINTFVGRYGIVQMKNDTYAFIDALTGSAHYTDYIDVSQYNEGFASVAVRADYENTNYKIA